MAVDPSAKPFVYVTVYSPDCRGLKSSGGATPPTAGQGLTPSGHCTVHFSEPGTASMLNLPVPAFRSAVRNGGLVMAWHPTLSLAKQFCVACTPPEHGPHLPFSLHFSLPGKHPSVLA